MISQFYNGVVFIKVDSDNNYYGLSDQVTGIPVTEEYHNKIKTQTPKQENPNKDKTAKPVRFNGKKRNRKTPPSVLEYKETYTKPKRSTVPLNPEELFNANKKAVKRIAREEIETQFVKNEDYGLFEGVEPEDIKAARKLNREIKNKYLKEPVISGSDSDNKPPEKENQNKGKEKQD